MHRRSSSRRCRSRPLGYEVAHVGLNQWNGVAIASRVGIDDVEVGFAGQPTWSAKPDAARPRPGRWARPAAACGCGACTSPTGAPWTTRTWTTSWTGLPRCAIPRPSWLDDDPDGPDRPGRRLEHRPADDDVWDIERVRRQHPRLRTPSARRSTRSSTPDSPTSVRPFTPGPGVYTYWDYTQLRVPAPSGMRIDFVLGLPGPGDARGRRRDRPRGTQGQGQPATTRRSW